MPMHNSSSRKPQQRPSPLPTRKPAGSFSGSKAAGKYGARSGLDPALKTALIFLVPTTIVRLILIFALDLAWVGLLLLSIVYLFAGYAAAAFFYQSVRQLSTSRNVETSRSKGVGACMLLCLFSWALFVLIVGLVPSLQIVDGPSLILIGPLEFLEAMALGALGTRLKSHAQ